MEKVKSKVISIRSNNQSINEFYDQNKEECKDKILDLLLHLSQGAEQKIDEGSKIDKLEEGESKANDISKSIAEFNQDIDRLVQSDDFENRMDEVGIFLDKLETNIGKIETNMVTKDTLEGSNQRYYFSLRNIIIISVFAMALVSISSYFLGS